MSALDLRSIARALGGEVQGRQVLAPAPGHRRIDRSLSVRLSAQSPTGFIVHTFSGHDFREARDYVAAKLELGPDSWKQRQDRTLYNIQGSAQAWPEDTLYKLQDDQSDNAARIARVRVIWDEARPATDSPVEVYLAGRGLRLDLVANIHEVIRYGARTLWRDDASDEVIQVPAMIACMRSIADDSITAVHKTRLTPEGVKVGRKMQGQASGSAIKLSADDEVTLGLHVSEGIETALAGLQLGLRPCWALGSAGAIERFAALAGIEALTLLAENDATNARAVEICAERWASAGAEVNIIRSTRGSDLNDVLKPEAV